MELTHSRRAQDSFKCLRGTFTPYEYLRLLFMLQNGTYTELIKAWKRYLKTLI
jgi:hypothetical protein